MDVARCRHPGGAESRLRADSARMEDEDLRYAVRGRIRVPAGVGYRRPAAGSPASSRAARVGGGFAIKEKPHRISPKTFGTPSDAARPSWAGIRRRAGWGQLFIDTILVRSAS